eukprot:CAMPEP_0170551650 /NCGR_PEP_ID=MMETSP0211-20121228/9661_1 /TAXON_ID=311385 /ORGANISM="Pseudokeronopsis sp., Strain OXSARD2" /LENGTH=501 /DNA_ID=CAMNT_0010858965 /DNA_START=331 /DNA_END=1831 /DNA_ORIENTATION=-
MKWLVGLFRISRISSSPRASKIEFSSSFRIANELLISEGETFKKEHIDDRVDFVELQVDAEEGEEPLDGEEVGAEQDRVRVELQVESGQVEVDELVEGEAEGLVVGVRHRGVIQLVQLQVLDQIHQPPERLLLGLELHQEEGAEEVHALDVADLLVEEVGDGVQEERELLLPDLGLEVGQVAEGPADVLVDLQAVLPLVLLVQLPVHLREQPIQLQNLRPVVPEEEAVLVVEAGDDEVLGLGVDDLFGAGFPILQYLNFLFIDDTRSKSSSSKYSATIWKINGSRIKEGDPLPAFGADGLGEAFGLGDLPVGEVVALVDLVDGPPLLAAGIGLLGLLLQQPVRIHRLLQGRNDFEALVLLEGDVHFVDGVAGVDVLVLVQDHLRLVQPGEVPLVLPLRNYRREPPHLLLPVVGNAEDVLGGEHLFELVLLLRRLLQRLLPGLLPRLLQRLLPRVLPGLFHGGVLLEHHVLGRTPIKLHILLALLRNVGGGEWGELFGGELG